VAGYKINIQISVAFTHTNKKHTDKEIRKIIPLIIASKISRNVLNQDGKRPL
jgi:hypothetical protein